MNDIQTAIKLLYNDVDVALKKNIEMIVWIAERVLPARDYREFIDTFVKRGDDE